MCFGFRRAGARFRVLVFGPVIALRKRGSLVLIASLTLLFAWVAWAQPKKGGKPAKDADKPAATATTEAPAATEKPEDDLGPPPPKTERSDEKVKSSPLNPAANEFPDGGVKPPPPQYDKLLGEIAALRSRVASLTTTLFASKLRVIVQTDGDDARISKFVTTLDDGVVFSAPDRFQADDERTIYEHAVAPGHHVIGIEIERYDARGREYQTHQASKFTVVVPEGKTLEVTVELEDDSDMAEDFPDDQDGVYELNTKLRARVAD